MPDPMYRQIAEDLLHKIDSGDLGRGGKPLPTELELREEYDSSRNTVRDAMKWLISRGVVETRPGKGTFVVEKINPFVTPLDVQSGFGSEGRTYLSAVEAGLRKADVSDPRIEVQQATGMVASELMLPEGTNVVSRHQRRFIDDTPWSLQTSFYPMRYVEQGAVDLLKAEDMADGTVRYLEQVLNVKQAGWQDKIIVRAPDMVESAFFRLPDDGRIAVFELQRTAFDGDGQPIRVTVTTYPADRNQFVVTSGKVPDAIPAAQESDPGAGAS
ncbi:MAG: GntR family transcriptional regulator [Streptosporangiaceae bacterium]